MRHKIISIAVSIALLITSVVWVSAEEGTTWIDDFADAHYQLYGLNGPTSKEEVDFSTSQASSGSVYSDGFIYFGTTIWVSGLEDQVADISFSLTPYGESEETDIAVFEHNNRYSETWTDATDSLSVTLENVALSKNVRNQYRIKVNNDCVIKIEGSADDVDSSKYLPLYEKYLIVEGSNWQISDTAPYDITTTADATTAVEPTTELAESTTAVEPTTEPAETTTADEPTTEPVESTTAVEPTTEPAETTTSVEPTTEPAETTTAVEPTTEPAESTTAVETTTNTAETTTAKSTSATTVKVGKVKLKKVYAKKRSAKKLKIKIKKVKKANGYQVAVFKTKKLAKKAKKALVKKFYKKNKKIITIKHKKLKKLKKKYYVRVRAYVLKGKTKVYGKWSNIKRGKTK